jgi:hypothetical protein
MAMKSTFNLAEAPKHTEAETPKKKKRSKDLIRITIMGEGQR